MSKWNMTTCFPGGVANSAREICTAPKKSAMRVAICSRGAGLALAFAAAELERPGFIGSFQAFRDTPYPSIIVGAGLTLWAVSTNAVANALVSFEMSDIADHGYDLHS